MCQATSTDAQRRLTCDGRYVISVYRRPLCLCHGLYHTVDVNRRHDSLARLLECRRLCGRFHPNAEGCKILYRYLLSARRQSWMTAKLRGFLCYRIYRVVVDALYVLLCKAHFRAIGIRPCVRACAPRPRSVARCFDSGPMSCSLWCSENLHPNKHSRPNRQLRHAHLISRSCGLHSLKSAGTN